MAALTFSRVSGPPLPPPIEGQRTEPDDCPLCLESMLSTQEAVAHEDPRNRNRHIHHLHPECYQKIIDAQNPASVDLASRTAYCPSCRAACFDPNMAPRMPLFEKITIALRTILVATFILSAWIIPLSTPWIAHIGSLTTCVVETLRPDMPFNERIASVAQMGMTALFWSAIFYQVHPLVIGICGIANFAIKGIETILVTSDEEIGFATITSSFNRYVTAYAQYHALLPMRNLLEKIIIPAVTTSILCLQRFAWPFFLSKSVIERLGSSRLSNTSQYAVTLLTCAVAFATLRSPGMLALYNQTPSIGAAYCASPFLALPIL